VQRFLSSRRYGVEYRCNDRINLDGQAGVLLRTGRGRNEAIDCGFTVLLDHSRVPCTGYAVEGCGRQDRRRYSGSRSPECR